MRLIAIDSSGLVASVAILEDDVLLASCTMDYKKTHSETLLPMLDGISEMIELDLSAVDAVAVAAGPGSFTGLRIGSATAKGLGLALNIPLIEVPTLAAMAYNLYNTRELICPIMDARRNQVYNGLYQFQNHKLVTTVDQRAIGVEELAEELNRRIGGVSEFTGEVRRRTGSVPEPDAEGRRPGHAAGVTLLGDGVAVYREELDRLLTVPHDYAPAHLNRQRAASVGALAQVLMREGKCVPAAQHVPVYLRKSQAERERDAKASQN